MGTHSSLAQSEKEVTWDPTCTDPTYPFSGMSRCSNPVLCFAFPSLKQIEGPRFLVFKLSMYILSDTSKYSWSLYPQLLAMRVPPMLICVLFVMPLTTDKQDLTDFVLLSLWWEYGDANAIPVFIEQM